MAEPQRVTEDQANQALQQLARENRGEEEPAQEEPVQEPEQPEPQAPQAAGDGTGEVQEAAAGEAGEPQPEPEEPQQAQPSAEAEQEARKQWEARYKAMQERAAQNEKILRDRLLSKSSAADEALKIIRASLTEQGVDRAEAERVIGRLAGTMHPESVSYAPPPPQAAPDTQDQALTLNAFLNEKGMTQDEAMEFGTWVRNEAEKVLSPSELAVGQQSLDGFLRIAHNRWQSGAKEADKTARRDAATEAVRSVQRTQRAAARAASTVPTAPRRQPAAPRTAVDVRKLTPDDVSRLVRESFEENL